MRIRQPRLLPAVWQVSELRVGRGFTWSTRSPGVRVTAEHEVEPSPGGSRATLAVSFAGPLAGPVAWLTSGLNQRYLLLEARGLRRRAEAAQP